MKKQDVQIQRGRAPGWGNGKCKGLGTVGTAHRRVDWGLEGLSHSMCQQCAHYVLGMPAWEGSCWKEFSVVGKTQQRGDS